MATTSSSTLLIVLLLGLLSIYGASLKVAATKKTWCVADPSADEKQLITNIKFACAYGDCGVIEKNGSCFHPVSLQFHASVVMNMYYRLMGANDWNCNFLGSGLITITDPSHDGCVYD